MRGGIEQHRASQAGYLVADLLFDFRELRPQAELVLVRRVTDLVVAQRELTVGAHAPEQRVHADFTVQQLGLGARRHAALEHGRLGFQDSENRHLPRVAVVVPRAAVGIGELVVIFLGRRRQSDRLAQGADGLVGAPCARIQLAELEIGFQRPRIALEQLLQGGDRLVGAAQAGERPGQTQVVRLRAVPQRHAATRGGDAFLVAPGAQAQPGAVGEVFQRIRLQRHCPLEHLLGFEVLLLELQELGELDDNIDALRVHRQHIVEKLSRLTAYPHPEGLGQPEVGRQVSRAAVQQRAQLVHARLQGVLVTGGRRGRAGLHLVAVAGLDRLQPGDPGFGGAFGDRHEVVRR